MCCYLCYILLVQFSIALPALRAEWVVVVALTRKLRAPVHNCQYWFTFIGTGAQLLVQVHNLLDRPWLRAEWLVVAALTRKLIAGAAATGLLDSTPSSQFESKFALRLLNLNLDLNIN